VQGDSETKKTYKSSTKAQGDSETKKLLNRLQKRMAIAKQKKILNRLQSARRKQNKKNFSLQRRKTTRSKGETKNFEIVYKGAMQKQNKKLRNPLQRRCGKRYNQEKRQNLLPNWCSMR
jgi:hypothetical protein